MRLCRPILMMLVSGLFTVCLPVLAGASEPVRTAIKQIDANVVFMRHALAPGFGDPETFRIDDCTTQRNLDQAGRRQAEDIGHYFRDHQILFTDIISSRWCRCTDTADLLDLGNWSEFDGLNSFFQNHVDRHKTLEQLNRKLDTVASDELVLMVTHQVVINAVTGISPPSGGLVVYNTRTQDAKAVRVPLP